MIQWAVNDLMGSMDVSMAKYIDEQLTIGLIVMIVLSIQRPIYLLTDCLNPQLAAVAPKSLIKAIEDA